VDLRAYKKNFYGGKFCISIAKILFVGQCKYYQKTESQNPTRANLRLAGGQVRAEGAESGANAPQNQWAALCAAHDLALKKPSSFVMVYLYNHARTYFSKNC
jgi:hypothetical protein